MLTRLACHPSGPTHCGKLGISFYIEVLGVALTEGCDGGKLPEFPYGTHRVALMTSLTLEGSR